MDAETRAALDTIRSMGVYVHGEGTREEAEEFDSAVAALQRLFDEKGGDGSGSTRETGPVGDSGVAAQSPIPVATPPDSLAKVAADLRDYCYRYDPFVAHTFTDMIRAWAVRIEALALEPSERETVARVVNGLQAYLTTKGGGDAHGELEIGPLGAIAALAPIAERKP